METSDLSAYCEPCALDGDCHRQKTDTVSGCVVNQDLRGHRAEMHPVDDAVPEEVKNLLDGYEPYQCIVMVGSLDSSMKTRVIVTDDDMATFEKFHRDLKDVEIIICTMASQIEEACKITQERFQDFAMTLVDECREVDDKELKEKSNDASKYGMNLAVRRYKPQVKVPMFNCPVKKNLPYQRRNY